MVQMQEISIGRSLVYVWTLLPHHHLQAIEILSGSDSAATKFSSIDANNYHAYVVGTAEGKIPYV